MASKAHQFIANMIGVKMRQLGYEVVSFDGKQIFLEDVMIPTPPCIKRHRPDLLGYNSISKKLCIGEAKTTADLQSSRTVEQIEDFSSLVSKSKKKVVLVIGIPSSAKRRIKEILKKMDLLMNKNIFLVEIPDRLLPT